MTKVDIIKYKCDKCGAQYNTEEEACGCEKAHIGVVDIKEIYYSTQCKYPYGVKLKMSDGEVLYFSK